jgi:hypothetical protein
MGDDLAGLSQEDREIKRLIYNRDKLVYDESGTKKSGIDR